MWNFGKTMPPSAWFGCGSGRNPAGQSLLERTWSGDSSASCSQVIPPGSLTRGPAWTGLPLVMVTPSAGRSARSYRCSSRRICRSITSGLAFDMRAMIVSKSSPMTTGA